jgi:UPF0271 protein
LFPELKKNALITNADEVFKHLLLMIKKEKVKTVSGIEKRIKADTFCVHGDTANSLEIVKNISKKLKKEGIQVGI